jgi:hypothetical protein
MRTLTLVFTSVFVLLCVTGGYAYQRFVLRPSPSLLVGPSSMASTASSTSPNLYIAQDQFYRGSLQDQQLRRATFPPFWIHGVNYYPQNQPWSLFWRRYSPEVVEKDLTLLAALGFNTVRIFLPYADFQDARNEKALSHFLKAAEAQHLKCILTLFDFYQGYTQPELAERYLEQLVPRFKDNAALLAWDLKNELDRDEQGRNSPERGGAFSRTVLQEWLDRMIPRLKALDPRHWVTLGWSQPEAMLRFRAAVDYDTFHYYGRPEDFQKRLEKVKGARQQQGLERPLVMGEFGYHTWLADPRDPHFPEHQYNYVTAMMAGRLSQSLGGSLFWNLYDYPETLTEDWVLQSPSFQYHMGLLDTQGQPKAGLKGLQQTVFVRDAESLGEITLNTRAIEALFYSQTVGSAQLEWVSPNPKAEGVFLSEHREAWNVNQGLNRLRWKVSAADIQALIYLRAQYALVAPPLFNLAGEAQPAQRQLLSLRLR